MSKLPTKPGIYWTGRKDTDGATGVEYYVWQIGDVYTNTKGKWFVWFLRDHYPVAINGLADDTIWQGPLKKPDRY